MVFRSDPSEEELQDSRPPRESLPGSSSAGRWGASPIAHSSRITPRSEDGTSPSPSPPPTNAIVDWTADVEAEIHRLEPRAFVVMPRVLRRVIRSELELSSIWLRVPHAGTYVIPRDRLVWFVAWDELGIEVGESLPDMILLIAREDRFTGSGIEQKPQLLMKYWRALFHARLDLELQGLLSPAYFPLAELRSRIDQIGQTEFDEIKGVLKSEGLLLDPESARQTYAEFVALYHELKFFEPELLGHYFPSLAITDALDNVLKESLPAEEIFEATRPPGLRTSTDVVSLREVLPNTAEEVHGVRGRRSPVLARWLMRAAVKPGSRGNDARAAMLLAGALEAAPQDLVPELETEFNRHLEQLATRITRALELEDATIPRWREVLAALARSSRHGFWNNASRLLYDLQKVCVDAERETYNVDAWQWLFSMGRKPLRTPLPNQRVVLITRHLRSAIARIGAAQVTPGIRDELYLLLEDAAHAAEKLARRQLRPLIEEALRSSGLVSGNFVESMAFGKVVDELLDQVVERGFFGLGNVRDALSRNALKLPDLSGVKEFVGGDALLRTDRALIDPLAGVYQPGPLYLRVFQRLSSLAFGVPLGRLFTKFIALPYGGAFIFLEGVQHLVGPVHEWFTHDWPDHHKLHLATLESVVVCGTFLLALIHVPAFRQRLWSLAESTWIFLRGVAYDIPHWLLKQPVVQAFLRSLPVRIIRRYLWTPLLVTIAIWLAIWAGGELPARWGWLAGVTFVASLALLNSRMGRDTEELVAEWASEAWHQFRVRVVVALFSFILDVFRRLMDLIERVLYSVDEWLRFRSGETTVSLAVKAVLGAIWSVIASVVRFCVTLLIEPQVNPIKHFPVVTVSHKLLLPLAIPLTKWSAPLLIPIFSAFIGHRFGHWLANAAGTIVITCIPGIFGFLVWELKENWRLYKANRRQDVGPTIIGHHGETMLRLLKPGFHSGTIPKLFARRRKAARLEKPADRIRKLARTDIQLEQLIESLHHFIERDFLRLLEASPLWKAPAPHLEQISISTNRIVARLGDPRLAVISQEGTSSALDFAETEIVGGQFAELEFAEQSGLIIAGWRSTGWIDRLDESHKSVLRSALLGFYKAGAVDIIREQIEHRLCQGNHRYDISPQGIVLWPNPDYREEVTYALNEQPLLTPRPRSIAKANGLEPVRRGEIVYHDVTLKWDDWVRTWDAGAATGSSSDATPPLLPSIAVYPPEDELR